MLTLTLTRITTAFAGRQGQQHVERNEMKNRWIIPLSFGAGILVTVLVPILVLATGMVNMGADVEPSFIERTLAPWARDRSVGRRVSTEKNPYAGDPAAIATGFDHYRENCVMCHGASGVQGAELSKGLNPPAPSLGKGEDDTDGELFWVIKHTIIRSLVPQHQLVMTIVGIDLKPCFRNQFSQRDLLKNIHTQNL